MRASCALLDGMACSALTISTTLSKTPCPYSLSQFMMYAPAGLLGSKACLLRWATLHPSSDTVRVAALHSRPPALPPFKGRRVAAS